MSSLSSKVALILVALAVVVAVPTWIAYGESAGSSSADGHTGVEGATPVGDPDVTVRRMWQGRTPDFNAAHASPDGRYVTDVDWDTGDLAVIDLLTAERRRVTDKGTWTENAEWAETGVFSPDASSIAFTYWSREGHYQIRTIGLDGSNEQVAFDFPTSSGFGLLQGWVGDRLLAWFWEVVPCADPPCPVQRDVGGDEMWEAGLAWVSLSDGSVEIIAPMEAEEMDGGRAATSFDGRFVAYTYPDRDNPDHRRDFTVVTSDGSPVMEMDGPPDDEVIGWNADGSLLFFKSDREFTTGVWAQEFSGGQPRGEPRLVRGDLWRMEPIGTARDGLLYAVNTDARLIRVASMDPETGAIASDALQLGDPSVETRAGSPVWSPDGQQLAYMREVRLPGGTRREISVRSMSGDVARSIELPDDMGLLLHVWTDGGDLIGRHHDEVTKERTLYRVNVATGEMSLIVGIWDLPVSVTPERYAISRDGKTGYFFTPSHYGAGWDAPKRIVAIDLETLDFRYLTDESAGLGQFFFLSPDEKTLAMTTGIDRTGAAMIPQTGVFTVQAVDGGELREVFSRESPFTVMFGSWAPDGRRIFARVANSSDPADPRIERWSIDIETGETALIPDSPEAMALSPMQEAIHPGGRRVAFVGGQPRAELWLMRGFDVEEGAGGN